MRMVGILEDCNYVEISFILKVKIFLKPLLLLPLISFSFLTPPLFLEILQHMEAFAGENCSDSSRELFVCSEEHPEGPLGCTRSPLILGNLFLPDVFPTATFLNVPLHYVA